jgi:hypothetical protein
MLTAREGEAFLARLSRREGRETEQRLSGGSQAYQMKRRMGKLRRQTLEYAGPARKTLSCHAGLSWGLAVTNTALLL